MTPQLPELPSCALLNDVAFAVCGFLLNGVQTAKQLIEQLRSIGWNPKSGKSAEYRIIRNFEDQGLISTMEWGGGTVCAITVHGFDAWESTFEFRRRTLEFFGPKRPQKRPKGLAEPVHRGLPPLPVERPPTEEEHKALLEKAKPEFRRVYEFSRASGARPMDLLNAQIEGFSRDNRFLLLNDMAVTGRKIALRAIPLNDECLAILNDAIGKRRSGEIFLGPKGTPWTYSNFSGTFRRIRKACGIPDEVVLSGRGGKVAAEVQTRKIK